MIEAMIDIETLDTANTAVIFQVGLVIFDDMSVLEEIQWDLNVQEQINSGRTITADTLAFHLGIPDNLKNSLEGSTTSTTKAMIDLRETCRTFDIENYWSKGNFDFNLLEDLFGKNQVPWTFFQQRELRTLMKEVDVKKGETTHNALQDCLDQLGQLRECRLIIKGA